MVNIRNINIISNAKNLTNPDDLHSTNFSLALKLGGLKDYFKNIRMHIFLSKYITYLDIFYKLMKQYSTFFTITTTKYSILSFTQSKNSCSIKNFMYYSQI